MFDSCLPSKSVLNLEDYKDKVLGCWTGKNIGGTIGAPFEGKTGMNEVVFYTKDLQGCPAPNDDLDLQLIWLFAAEENGIYRLTPRMLGEYWVNCIVGPWNEYSVCKANIANGLYPPLSGSCNNDVWKNSNGAWIRSEIWACVFPGTPDEAAMFAYMDACCDHSDEGILSEIFTASLESAAFLVSDLRKLIAIGLARIPQDCRVARCIALACELFDKGTPFKEARERIVKETEDMGWFQAPANIGFVILGLLYGQGDFGKSVCLAVNCGDDTDCTAATVGSILGIINGRRGIPEKWTKPIGESIKTLAIDTFFLNIPSTLGELTDRVAKLAVLAQHENPTLPRIAREPGVIDERHIEKLLDGAPALKRLQAKSPYRLDFDLPYGELSIDYENGPFIVPGETKKLELSIVNAKFIENAVNLSFKLPPGWSSPSGASVSLSCVRGIKPRASVILTPGEFDDAFVYIPLEVRLAGRFNPVTVNIPFQRLGQCCYYPPRDNCIFQDYWDKRDRRLARYAIS